MPVELATVHVENLRGYESASLTFNRPKTLLVGRNNSGKTSILRLLSWVINDVSESVLRGEDQISTHDLNFLLPARETRHRARRLTLDVKIRDRRSHRRFQCRDGIAQLRLNLRQTPKLRLFLALGDPTRGELAESQTEALKLLKKLRKSTYLIFIPSFRDVASPRFKKTLLEAFSAKLEHRALHTQRGGAPSQYRTVIHALEELKNVAETLAQPLWEEMREQLPPGLAQDARIELDCNPETLVDWLTKRLTMKVSTGLHDASAVPMTELGSGLQSLLDLAVHRTGKHPTAAHRIIVVEEPESFLHPSAQRIIARALLSAGMADKAIVTTHSPIVVEEAGFGEVVLCRDQRFYEPTTQSDPKREEINAALLSGYGAEMLFSRSVILVEGEGDRQFLERLRRRIAAIDRSGRCDELAVVPVGGKQRFAPWMRLLQSYGASTDRPVRWLVVADGDAGSDVRTAFKDATVTVPRDVLEQLNNLATKSGGDVTEWVGAVRQLNHATKEKGTQFCLLPVDLEHAALSRATDATLAAVAQKAGWQPMRREDLLRRLGSKAVQGGSDPSKHPWVRGYIGSMMPWGELSEDVLDVLWRWLKGAMPDTDASELLNSPALQPDEAT